MKEIELVVYGDPRAQKRHRTVRVGKFNRQYDPSDVDKKDFLTQLIESRPKVPIDVEIELTLRFYFTRPKYHYGTGKRSMIKKSSAPINHSKKPDIDNLIKFVLDAMNKTYWRDDAQVYFITVSKHYTDKTPRTEIRINYKENAEQEPILSVEL